MNIHDRSDIPWLISGRSSWAAKALYGLVAILLIAAGFFFLTVALVAGAFVALVILARLWWVLRKRGRAQEQTELEGEFTVVERRTSMRQVDGTAADHRP